MGTLDTEAQEYGDGISSGDAGQATEATGKNGRRWKRFCSASALVSITTKSTLPLINLKWDLNDDDKDVQHPPCCLRLGRGNNLPLQASNRGGGVGDVSRVGGEETPRGLRGRGRMHTWKSVRWRRGHHKQVTLLSLFWTR